MKVMKTVVLTVAAVLMIGVLFAGAVSADASGNCGKQGSNLQWAFFDSNKTLVITGSGMMNDYIGSKDVPWDGNRSSITSVKLPNGLQNIGNFTFSNCGALKSIEIPASVTSIDIGAFMSSTALTSIAIPASVTSIDMGAFVGCSNLTTVTFAKGSQLTTIGDNAFYQCTALKSIEIPASVTAIGKQAFYQCIALTTVTFSEGSKLTTIDQKAFRKSALTSIEIPASVETIGGIAFSGCSALKTVKFAEGSKLKTIDMGAFGETGLTSTEIPASVTTIGESAFTQCGSLTEVTFADVSKLSTIGKQAFSSCTALKKVVLKKGTFPSDVTFGDEVFLASNNFSTVISDKLQTPAVMSNFVVPGSENEDIKPVWYISEIQTSALPEGYDPYYIGELYGGTLKANFVQQKDSNGNYILPTANDVTRKGYEFIKWVNNGDEVTNLTDSCKNATVNWNRIEYTITYHLDGGKNHAGNPDTYTVEDDDIILKDATKDGYTFGGWYDSEDNKITEIAKGSTGNKVLYAKWTASHRGHSASIPTDYTPSSSVPVMVQETAKPTTTPTVAAPTVMPTTKPTTQQTQKSPAPFAGLVLGFGAAALLIRMRR